MGSTLKTLLQFRIATGPRYASKNICRPWLLLSGSVTMSAARCDRTNRNIKNKLFIDYEFVVFDYNNFSHSDSKNCVVGHKRIKKIYRVRGVKFFQH